MIISVNGRSVGGMTLAEFQIELDICGPEVMLVVSRYDVNKEVVDSCTHGENSLSEMGMDWNDIGAVTPSVQKKVTFNAGGNQTNVCTSGQEQISVNSQVSDTKNNHTAPQKKSTINDTSQVKKRLGVDANVNKMPSSLHGSNLSAKVKKVNQDSRNTHKAAVEHNTTSTTNSSSTGKEPQALIRRRKQYESKSHHSKEDPSVSLDAKTHYSLKKKADSLDVDDLPSSEEEEDASFVDSEDDDDENPWLGW
jgi:hypothetical protein